VVVAPSGISSRARPRFATHGKPYSHAAGHRAAVGSDDASLYQGLSSDQRALDHGALRSSLTS
jgi:hypothetical protein